MKTIALPTALLTLACGLLPAAETGSFDRTVSVSGPVDLEVETDAGGIPARQGAPGGVQIHGILKGENGWWSGGDASSRIKEIEGRPPSEQNGNRVRVGEM